LQIHRVTPVKGKRMVRSKILSKRFLKLRIIYSD
jgi:hypothetical protein